MLSLWLRRILGLDDQLDVLLQELVLVGLDEPADRSAELEVIDSFHLQLIDETEADEWQQAIEQARRALAAERASRPRPSPPPLPVRARLGSRAALS